MCKRKEEARKRPHSHLTWKFILRALTFFYDQDSHNVFWGGGKPGKPIQQVVDHFIQERIWTCQATQIPISQKEHDTNGRGSLVLSPHVLGENPKVGNDEKVRTHRDHAKQEWMIGSNVTKEYKLFHHISALGSC